ncbi:hypothetical protein RJ640_013869 [Escallonia rubra]|uniref:Bet v I/Major latex protein domain-containing protein n=2 Tax=Escallonia rubra TaxID=112253 RepID=A0AA88UE59_9ASTE|nr:hypothetical protein RJ640_013869 [Escallonia rubra]
MQDGDKQINFQGPSFSGMEPSYKLPDNIALITIQYCMSLKMGKFSFDWHTYGKAEVSKQIIEAIDMEKKTVVYKLIGGDAMELYKSFTAILHVDTKSENNLVRWTFEYEKMNEGIQDPTNYMDFLVKVTKDIETHHLQQ